MALIIPTLNGAATLPQLFQSLETQTLQPQYRIIVDSQSTDQTGILAARHLFEVIPIKQCEFNHGGTRQMVIERICQAYKEIDSVVFMTQDACFADDYSLARLMDCLNDEQVGAAYGRQLPRQNSGKLGSHARLFNYPEVSSRKTLQDASRWGIKTAFISNSFAVYRVSALHGVGGFPDNTILSEDMCLAGKMLLQGWSVYYCADSRVYHSHDYSCSEEFRRYFDIGVFQSREDWLRQTFGPAEGEGLRFVFSEMRYLWQQQGKHLIPAALMRTGLKLLAFRLGKMESWLPVRWKRWLSMNKNYWH
ncbi:MAG TPA: glycosyltransferase [Patescibacteria group bacterium]|nr:glycosyltransferase [Patescibacteria group bacterium]